MRFAFKPMQTWPAPSVAFVFNTIVVAFHKKLFILLRIRQGSTGYVGVMPHSAPDPTLGPPVNLSATVLLLGIPMRPRNPALYYCSPSPCKNGHQGMRYKRTGRCVDCKNASTRRKKKRHTRGWLYLVRKAKERAHKKNIPFSLTHTWASSRWTGRCELTGIEFVRGEMGFSPYSGSIDRIEPSKGYTDDNCRFVLMAVNAFKGKLSDAEMLTIAKAML